MNLIGLLFVVAGGLLACTTGLGDTHETIKLLCLAVGGCVLWIPIIQRQRGVLPATPLDIPIVLFWASIILSTVFSQEIWYSLFGIYKAPFHAVVPLLVATLLYYAAANGDWENEFLFKWMLGTGFIISIWAISQVYTEGYPWKIPDGRVTGSSGSPVYLGAYLVLLTPVAIRALFLYRGNMIIILLAAALIYSRSRGACLSAGIAAFAYLLFSGRIRMVRREWLLLALMLTIAGAGLGDRFSKFPGDSMRVELWKISLAALKEHPIVGTGPETFAPTFRRLRTDRFIELRGVKHIQGSAHNDVFQMLCTQGFLGVISYHFLLGAITGLLWWKRKKYPDAVALVAATLLGVWCQAKVNPIPISVTAICAVMVGLLVRIPNIRILEGNIWEKDQHGLTEMPSRRHFGYVLAALALCSMLVVGKQVLADRYFRIALNKIGEYNAVVSDTWFRKAIACWPWNMRYRNFYLQFLGHWLDGLPKSEEKRIGQQALDVGLEAVTTSPNDPEAWEVYGFALMANGQHSQAGAALFRAQQLDPKFLPVLRARMKIAARMKDFELWRLMMSKYKRIRNLAEKGGGKRKA